VDNAGYGNVAPIEDTSIEEFRAQIEINLSGSLSSRMPRLLTSVSQEAAISFKSARSDVRAS
jgi:NAD(P)-dependent dehydrogenase (short-subunit alcohol dehydrogenase family)